MCPGPRNKRREGSEGWGGTGSRWEAQGREGTGRGAMKEGRGVERRPTAPLTVLNHTFQGVWKTFYVASVAHKLELLYKVPHVQCKAINNGNYAAPSAASCMVTPSRTLELAYLN